MKKQNVVVQVNGLEIKGDVSAIRALLGLSEESSVQGTHTPETKAPKGKTKTAKAPKAEKAAKAEEPKPEDPKSEFAYTSGGAIIQYGDNHTLKANNLRRVNNAIDKLVKAGFCASWKRIGGWVYLYHSKKADGKTMAEFQAVALAKGWEFSKKHNAWIDSTMLADYADNFKA